MSYLDALSQLCQPIRAGEYPQTLTPMLELMAALGNPQQKLRAVVVAGSTGKGTTCYHIAQLLRASGLNVGLYTSPHLHSFRERFIYNDVMISGDAFVEAYAAVQAAMATLNHRYSTFEQATALTLWWFARQQPDVVVLEIGLGGRFDAVNVVDNLLAVLTPIEMEHAAMLGGSQRAVAWHKAGIIKHGGQAITIAQSPDVLAVLEAEAHQQQAQLQIIGDDTPSAELSNDPLAVAVWQNLVTHGLIPPGHIKDNFHFDNLPGRLEQVPLAGRTLLIDGGHTPNAARRLHAEISRLVPSSQPVRLVIGMLGDKFARDYLAHFDSERFRVVLTQAPGHRAMSAQALYEQVELRLAPVKVMPNRAAAFGSLYTAPEALVVVTGSLRMAAAAREYFGLLSPTALAEAEATRAIFEGAAYLNRLGSSTGQTE